MFIGLCDPSCWFWSRATQALAPRVGYCDLEFVCDLVLVIWIFIIAQFVPDQSFFYGSDWKLAADGGGTLETFFCASTVRFLKRS